MSEEMLKATVGRVVHFAVESHRDALRSLSALGYGTSHFKNSTVSVQLLERRNLSRATIASVLGPDVDDLRLDQVLAGDDWRRVVQIDARWKTHPAKGHGNALTIVGDRLVIEASDTASGHALAFLERSIVEAFTDLGVAGIRVRMRPRKSAGRT